MVTSLVWVNAAGPRDEKWAGIYGLPATGQIRSLDSEIRLFLGFKTGLASFQALHFGLYIALHIFLGDFQGRGELSKEKLSGLF